MEQDLRRKKLSVIKLKTKNSFTVSRNFFEEMRKKRILTVTGCWVYYFLMSIIPLVFLLITAFSIFSVDLSVELIRVIPVEFKSALEAVVKTASDVSNSVTIFFIITVIISCSTLLNQMSKDGDYIYGNDTHGRRGVVRRLSAIAFLCVLFSLFIAFALCFSFRNYLLNWLGFNKPNLITLVSFSIIILFAYGLILLLLRFISPKKLNAFALSFSGLISLAIMVFGTIGLILYIRFFSNYNAFYGSLAGIVVFFLWAFVLMFSLSFGSLVCKRLNEKTDDK